jgi:hypothetical protein
MNPARAYSSYSWILDRCDDGRYTPIEGILA